MTAPKFVVQADAEKVVSAYIADGAAHDVLSMRVDGRILLVAFELDTTEHTRRLEGSMGPVRSRGLLHALWTLPEGLAWPTSALDRLDADTLKHEGNGFVKMNGDSVVRVYCPAGQVRAIALRSRRLTDAVTTASEFPPIFRRYAIGTRAGRTDPDAVAVAQSVGVGAAITLPAGLRVFAGAEPPQVGVPGVYRWWLAEVAYRSWLQTNAH